VVMPSSLPQGRLTSTSTGNGHGVAGRGTTLRAVPRIVVDVMPKPEILDPQGKAVLGALPRLGFAGVTDVRQGKRFELEIEGEATDELLERARRMAETLLSNPVIEDFEVRLVEPAEPAEPAETRA